MTKIKSSIAALFILLALTAAGETFYSTYLNGFAHFSRNVSAEIQNSRLCIDNDTDAPIMIIDTMCHDRHAAFRFVARIANRHNTEGKSYRYFDSKAQKTRKTSNTEWGVVWNYVDSTDFCRLTLCSSGGTMHDILDQRSITATITRTGGGSTTLLKQLSLTKNVNLSEGDNIIHIVADDSGTTILLGNSRLSTIATLPDVPIVAGSHFGAFAGKGSLLSIERLVIQSTHSPVDDLATGWTADSLDTRFAHSTDPIEGYWDYLDRSLDESALRLGGRYRIALIKTATGYDIIYIAGAEVDANLWRPGMLKGKLSPTRFIDSYDLVWYDSEKQPFTADVHASIENAVILTLDFPLAGSRLRFVKAQNEQ